MIRKYKPTHVKVRSWQEIENHYLDLNNNGWGHDRLLNLVRHIRSSGLQDRLFACTSLDRLVISIYDPIAWGTESLMIEYDRTKEIWHFQYFPKPFEETFERYYDSDLGIEKFDQFISMIKW